MGKKRTDYHPCPTCGANLDPGELCVECAKKVFKDPPLCEELKKQEKDWDELVKEAEALYGERIWQGKKYPQATRIEPWSKCDPSAFSFAVVKMDSPRCFQFLAGNSDGDLIAELLEGPFDALNLLKEDYTVYKGDYIVRPLAIRPDIRLGYYKVPQQHFDTMFKVIGFVREKFGFNEVNVDV